MDIQEFEAILLARKQNLLEILNARNSNIKELNSSSIKDDSDLVSAHMQGQIDSLMMEKHMQELQEVEKSLQKVQDGIYGICEMCDEEIDEGRLRIKPHARFCINCREVFEKSQAK